jgi:hypothetical protein
MPNWCRKVFWKFAALGSYFAAKLPRSGRIDDVAGSIWISATGFCRTANVKRDFERWRHFGHALIVKPLFVVAPDRLPHWCRKDGFLQGWRELAELASQPCDACGRIMVRR